MNDLPAVPLKVIVQRETVPHALRHGGIEIDNAILFSWPAVNDDNKTVAVRNLVGVAADRYRLLTNPANLHVCLYRGDDKPHKMLLAYQHADGNEGNIDNDAVLPLTTPLMLVIFLLWGLSVKNQSVIPLVKKVHGDDLALELPSRRHIVVSIESIFVPEGADEDQRARVNIDRTTADNLQT